MLHMYLLLELYQADYHVEEFLFIFYVLWIGGWVGGREEA